MFSLSKKAEERLICCFGIGILFIPFFLILADIFFTLDSEAEYGGFEHFPNASGTYIATSSYAVWGAAGYSYCFDRVTINPTAAGASETPVIPVTVYEGHCFVHHQKDIPFVQWVDDHTLRITIYPDKMGAGNYDFVPDPYSGSIAIVLDVK